MEENNIESVLSGVVQDCISKKETVNFKILKEQAATFLTSIESSLTITEHQDDLYDQMLKVKDCANNQIEQMNIKGDNNILGTQLQAQLRFETVLNQFLGRVILLTWVNDKGKLFAFDEVGIGKIYEQATRGKGVGKINTMSETLLKESVDSVNKQLEQSSIKRCQVYTTAIERYNKNSERKKYYWVLNDNTWELSKLIQNRGRIAEAYAGAVIHQNDNIINDQLETSLKNLNDLIGHDNQAGAVKGDIVLNDEGFIQFAIKSGKFQTEGIFQYIALAFNVTQLPDSMAKDTFEKNLKELLYLSHIAEGVINEARQKVGQQASKAIGSSKK